MRASLIQIAICPGNGNLTGPRPTGGVSVEQREPNDQCKPRPTGVRPKGKNNQKNPNIDNKTKMINPNEPSVAV